MARALAGAGAKVAICDVDEARAQAAAEDLVAQGAQAMAVALNVTEPAGWEVAALAVRERFGEVTIFAIMQALAAAAGWLKFMNPMSGIGCMGSMLIACFTRCGPFAGHEGRWPGLPYSEYSLDVWCGGNAELCAYVSSKYAAMGFTLALRNELNGTNVGVSVLCPGMTATRIVETTQSLWPGQAESGARCPNCGGDE